MKRMNLNVPTRIAQQLQVRYRGRGKEHDRRFVGVHPELRRGALVSEAEGAAQVKRAALYSRVSTYDQNPQTQILDLRQMAAQRGYEVVA